MTLTANQQTIDDLYRELFPHRTKADGTGGGASFGTLGGADYWVDKLDQGTSSADEIKNMLMGSQEYQTQTVGGLDESKTMAENAAAGNVWAGHFDTGGGLSSGTDLSNTIWAGKGTGTGNNLGTSDAASAANNIASALGYTPNTLSGNYTNTGITGGGDDGSTGDGDAGLPGTPDYLTSDDLTTWWDALDKSSFTGNQSGGMDDFMKFMMLMSVMGGKGGQGGYGGSQYGYGGLNPGGVMQAYDPLAQLQGMGTWFKDNFGSGGATTSTVNTGTAGN